VTNQPQLTAKDIHRSFKIGSRKIDVLRGISMEVHRGEALFLCGVSGAGKTTLLYTLAGLERPEAGEVIFEGHKLYRNGSSELFSAAGTHRSRECAGPISDPK
jgi:ABC-type lipoprotein export system ATPase subunit